MSTRFARRVGVGMPRGGFTSFFEYVPVSGSGTGWNLCSNLFMEVFGREKFVYCLFGCGRIGFLFCVFCCEFRYNRTFLDGGCMDSLEFLFVSFALVCEDWFLLIVALFSTSLGPFLAPTGSFAAPKVFCKTL